MSLNRHELRSPLFRAATSEARISPLILSFGRDVGPQCWCSATPRDRRNCAALERRDGPFHLSPSRTTSFHQVSSVFDVLRRGLIVVEELPNAEDVQTARAEAKVRSQAEQTDEHGKVKVKPLGNQRNEIHLAHDLESKVSTFVVHSRLTLVKIVWARSVFNVII